MKPEEFYQRLQEVHGITLSDEQKKQFDQYFHLLVEWNEKMNLTAITDEEGVYLKHFYDSLALGFHHELTDQTLCDVWIWCLKYKYSYENCLSRLEGDDCGFVK